MDNKRLVLILLVIIVIFGCKVTCSNINEYYKNYSKQKIDDCKKCRCRHDNNDRCSEECPSDMNIGVFNCISSDGQNYKLEKKNYVDNKGFNQEDNQEDNQGSTIREDCTWSNNKCIPNDQYYQGNQNKYNKKQENNRCLSLDKNNCDDNEDCIWDPSFGRCRLWECRDYANSSDECNDDQNCMWSNNKCNPNECKFIKDKEICKNEDNCKWFRKKCRNKTSNDRVDEYKKELINYEKYARCHKCIKSLSSNVPNSNKYRVCMDEGSCPKGESACFYCIGQKQHGNFQENLQSCLDDTICSK
jgi:hypothetical protein